MARCDAAGRRDTRPYKVQPERVLRLAGTASDSAECLLPPVAFYADGSGTPLRPVPVISKTPSSFVEPKRFFTARRMRWAW